MSITIRKNRIYSRIDLSKEGGEKILHPKNAEGLKVAHRF